VKHVVWTTTVGIGWLEAADEVGEDHRFGIVGCGAHDPWTRISFSVNSPKSGPRSRRVDHEPGHLEMDQASEVFRRHGTRV